MSREPWTRSAVRALCLFLLGLLTFLLLGRSGGAAPAAPAAAPGQCRTCPLADTCLKE
jgi:hypothetical protein